MQRAYMEKLIEWKERTPRKPLLLEGVRQCGKTWLVNEFGKTQFAKTAYISLQDNERMAQLFEGNITPERIIPALSLESGVAIDPTDTLIILDEVQEVPRALTSLKYFNEQAPEYAIIATGSSLGIALHPGTSFPVGKVEIGKLYPLSFREFLWAMGETEMAELIDSGDLALISAFHGRIMELLKYYFVVGGMPEVVEDFVSSFPSVDHQRIRELQNAIIADYREDFSKHQASAPRGLTLRLNQVWASLPGQLARENKKFVYGAVKHGGRGKDYELAIQWLVDTSLVIKIPRVSTPGYPLKIYEDLSAFKLYLSDIGLLFAMLEINPSIVLDGDGVLDAAKGALAEQFACQELTAAGINAYYWSAPNSSAELDFLVQQDAEVVPIEVKSGENLQSKSLKAAIKRFDFDKAYRFSALPPKQDGVIEDLPLYTISQAMLDPTWAK